MKRILFNFLVFLQVHRLLRRWARKRVTILGYHGFVGDEGLSPERNPQGMHLDRARFAEQLRYVKENYNVVSLEELVRRFQEGSLPDHPLVITIDDGYRSTYTQAWPVLEEVGLPSSLFVATGFVDGKEMLWHDRVAHVIFNTDLRFIHLDIEGEIYSFELEGPDSRSRSLVELLRALKEVPNETRLKIVQELEWLSDLRLTPENATEEQYRALDWDQVRAMQWSNRMMLGCHTVSHPIVTRCSPRKLREELVLAKTRLEEQLSAPCDHFCYPNGTRSDFNQETRSLLEELGFRSALTTVPGLNDGHTDLLELRRFTIDSRLDLAGFIATITGLNYCLSLTKRSLLGFLRNPLSIRPGVKANG